MQAPVTIRTWDDLRAYYDRLTADPRRRWLFRGQPSTLRLRTSLERAVRTRFQEPFARMRWFEDCLTREFQRHFHRYSNTVVDERDWLRWLALMRDHGAPTRLLDWSYSFYIALFFAVEDASPGTAATVWTLDPAWCWRRAAGFVDRDVLERLRANDKDLEATAALLSRDSTGGGILPLTPFGLDERLALQQGVFVVPLDLRVSFMENLFAMAGRAEIRQNCSRIEICWTKELLVETLTELHRMNINRRTLFPGIDGLAGSLENMIPMPHLFRMLDEH